MKYPNRNNHESLVDFIQLDANEMIKRGIARIINTNGPIKRFLDMFFSFSLLLVVDYS
jgi:hypothetical protein